MHAGRVLLLIAAISGLFGLAACATASNQPALEAAVTSGTPLRSGSVYVLRGFMGISSGSDTLKDELGRLGVRASAYDPEQWREVVQAILAGRAAQKTNAPIILVGFSAGAGNAIRISQALGEAGVAVDLLVTLDPSSPLDPLSPRTVPANVRKTLNLYQRRSVLQGVPLTLASGAEGKLVNINLDHVPGIGHPGFAGRPEVREKVIPAILEAATQRR